MVELKACPFCSWHPEISERHLKNHDAVWLTCNCMHKLIAHGKTLEEAAEKWNYRPLEDALQAEIDRLKTEVDTERNERANADLAFERMHMRVSHANNEIDRLNNIVSGIVGKLEADS